MCDSVLRGKPVFYHIHFCLRSAGVVLMVSNSGSVAAGIIVCCGAVLHVHDLVRMKFFRINSRMPVALNTTKGSCDSSNCPVVLHVIEIVAFTTVRLHLGCTIAFLQHSSSMSR